MIDGIIYNRFNFIINNVGYNNSNMEKLSSIIHKSALETYDLVEKNKTLIVKLITMFMSKETRDFIFKKDFESGKVKYQSVKQTELNEFKFRNKFASIRRIIAVKGLYKNEIFEMKLSVLEFWIRQKSIWKLWSRQSVGLK